jgi:hypothetical protein
MNEYGILHDAATTTQSLSLKFIIMNAIEARADMLL